MLSNSCLDNFFSDSSGLPLPRFHAAAAEYSPVNGIDAEIGIGDNGNAATLPSGPYFLGLPLFFFTTSVLGVAAATLGGAVDRAGVGAGAGAVPVNCPQFSLLRGDRK